METFTTIILLFAVVALGYLYWNAKKKLKTAEELKDVAIRESIRLKNGNIENKKLLDELNQFKINRYQEQKEHDKLKNAYEVKNQTINDLKAEIAAKDEEFQVLQQNLLEEMGRKAATHLTRPIQDVRGILDSLIDESGFVCEGVIDSQSITINIKDLLQEKHIKIIEKLNQAGLFPEHLESDFNFDADESKVSFYLLEFNEAFEIIGFCSWEKFLADRKRFIDAITDYVEGVVQESTRANVVQQALIESSNNGRKEAVAS